MCEESEKVFFRMSGGGESSITGEEAFLLHIVGVSLNSNEVCKCNCVEGERKLTLLVKNCFYKE